MIYLASASPRRQELLRQLGVSFEVRPSNLDEQRAPGESPAAYVGRVAADKARHVTQQLKAEGASSAVVLGADTEVVLDDEVLGKPLDRAHARAMLARLAGKTHRVLTGICLVTPAGEHRALSESRVTFAPLAPGEIERYVASGEADDKAGGYAVQGRAAGFIVRLEGSYSGVMGLPLYELSEMLKQAGVNGP